MRTGAKRQAQHRTPLQLRLPDWVDDEVRDERDAFFYAGRRRVGKRG